MRPNATKVAPASPPATFIFHPRDAHSAIAAATTACARSSPIGAP